MKIIRAKDYADMSRKAANIISAQVIMKPNCVLGLATGGTPVGAYAQLVDWYNKGDIDFSEVTTVNLDEYRGLPKEQPESYWSVMHRNLFDKVNIDPAKINLPDGTNPDAEDACAKSIAALRLWAGRSFAITGKGEPMRLDKYLAETAQCTRSEAKTLLSRGRVTVNGAVCKKGDTQLREGDSVAVDGAPLAYQQFVYLMLNKPEGVVSASTDKRDTTVVDLIGDAYPRRELFPAGRLDKTSTGFVLLTDDGGFAHEILAPKRHVSKTYTVVIDTPLTEEMCRGFAEGVTLADGTALSPAEVEALTPDGLTVKVRLRQGVYHQIKRMFGVYGAGVNALHRDAIGGLALDPALAPGQWRELSAEEVTAITTGA